MKLLTFLILIPLFVACENRESFSHNPFMNNNTPVIYPPPSSTTSQITSFEDFQFDVATIYALMWNEEDVYYWGGVFPYMSVSVPTRINKNLKTSGVTNESITQALEDVCVVKGGRIYCGNNLVQLPLSFLVSKAHYFKHTFKDMLIFWDTSGNTYISRVTNLQLGHITSPEVIFPGEYLNKIMPASDSRVCGFNEITSNILCYNYETGVNSSQVITLNGNFKDLAIYNSHMVFLTDTGAYYAPFTGNTTPTSILSNTTLNGMTPTGAPCFFNDTQIYCAGRSRFGMNGSMSAAQLVTLPAGFSGKLSSSNSIQEIKAIGNSAYIRTANGLVTIVSTQTDYRELFLGFEMIKAIEISAVTERGCFQTISNRLLCQGIEGVLFFNHNFASVSPQIGTLQNVISVNPLIILQDESGFYLTDLNNTSSFPFFANAQKVIKAGGMDEQYLCASYPAEIKCYNLEAKEHFSVVHPGYEFDLIPPFYCSTSGTCTDIRDGSTISLPFSGKVKRLALGGAIALSESGEIWDLVGGELVMTGVDDMQYSIDLIYQIQGRYYLLEAQIETDLIYLGKGEIITTKISKKSLWWEVLGEIRTYDLAQ